jgi:hypothetical protein
MYIIRQSTARDVLIGPFVDSLDGNTAETGLTISNTDIRLSKNGANIVAKNSGGGTHDEIGYYTITLDTTDTNTVGTLQLMVHESGALPVYHEYQVIEEAIFDALFAASAAAFDANQDVTVGAFAANAITAAAIADNAIDAGAIATGTITAAKFAAGAIDAAAVATDIVTEIRAGLATSAELADLATSAEIAALNDLSAADVNAEIVDALATDTYAEPTGVPPATDTLANKIGRLHMAMRNKVTVTVDDKTFHSDAGTATWKQALTDDGTTYTQNEAAAP